MSWRSVPFESGEGSTIGRAGSGPVEVPLAVSSAAAPGGRDRLRVVLGVAVVATAVWFLLSTGERVEPGAQIGGEPVTLGLAARTGWTPLVDLSGQPRPDFGVPMVWKRDRVCIGLSRVDFGPEDVRPSLARCVPGSTISGLAANEIVTIATIVAGLDTWHFVEAGSPVERVRVELVDQGRLGGDRIHLAGSTFALRLENATDLERIEWGAGDLTYRCAPDPAAWRTSTFCPSDPSDVR